MKISYLVTVHNEVDTFKKLIKVLDAVICDVNAEDEIVIIDDFSDNEETRQFLDDVVNCNEKHMYPKLSGISVFQHALNNDYSSHKNFGMEKCKGDFIFQIDGDELPPEALIGDNLKLLIESNPAVELYYVPRINDFKGVTQEHANQWGWRLTPSSYCNGRSIVNWPDYQGRIYRNVPEKIKWDRKLHEKIIGHNEYSFLPSEEDYALYHDKTIEKQIQTNLRYNQVFTEEDNKGHKVA